MDDLNPYEQSVCEFLDNLGVIFETPKILTREYRASDLKKYIEKQMVSSLSKIKLARRLKGIKAPQPSLVADDGGSSPFVVDSKDVERTTSGC
ncbi:hypothetical protein PHAVU_011G138700, partial [Phaseolus vulgaris]|uniref:Uncharacterized protein n=1 Tax=Phaseolus vulgaris TaxID=3885 RepID=V7AHA3_PHAVU|nr:hypothetical protein PHAVU_011G138700g [Phaseolus vulgaris]ESW04944.1 hypothetical protein PHAVU_011G138700g [Phaseolus vulgaris]